MNEMAPLISIVGQSGVGKTTLLEYLVRELKGRGYRLAVIKHVPHGFELDQSNKDSWRLAQAGSDAVMLSSPSEIAIVRPLPQEFAPEQLSCFMGWDFDLILTEGFKGNNLPKIEVHPKGSGELLCPTEQLFALVTDEDLDLALPQFSWEEISELADAIEVSFLTQQREEIALSVNGKPLSLNPFVREFMTKTLLSMVSVLKGVEEIENLNIWLRKGTRPSG